MVNVRYLIYRSASAVANKFFDAYDRQPFLFQRMALSPIYTYPNSFRVLDFLLKTPTGTATLPLSDCHFDILFTGELGPLKAWGSIS
ncbi:hypothetical protein ACU8KH_01527 [Lachancea thermotolerans]